MYIQQVVNLIWRSVFTTAYNALQDYHNIVSYTLHHNSCEAPVTG